MAFHCTSQTGTCYAVRLQFSPCFSVCPVQMQSFQTHLDQVHKVHADAMQQMEGTMRTLLDATTSHRSQATDELRSAISQIKGWSQEENARVVSQVCPETQYNSIRQ